jgi:DNA-binding CsgD family transcriptional regulator
MQKPLTSELKQTLDLIALDVGIKEMMHVLRLSRSGVQQRVQALHRRFKTGGSHAKLFAIASSHNLRRQVEETLGLEGDHPIWSRLRPLEKQVALLAAHSWTSVKIGVALGRSSGSVENNLRVVYRVLGVPGKVGLAIYLTERQLIVQDIQQILDMCPPPEGKKP